MKKVYLLSTLYFLLSVGLTGCSIPMFATRDDLLQVHQTESAEFSRVKQDITSLQEKQDEMFRKQATLYQELKELNLNITALREKISENKECLSLIAQRMDDLDVGINQKWKELARRLELSPAGGIIEPKPSELYQLACNDYSRGKYDLAILGFENYLKKYPNSELAANAQFYLGECQLAKKDWAKALEEYEKVKIKYPRSDKVLIAELKKSVALKELNKTDEAKGVLEWIISNSPNSLEAVLAREKLKEWFPSKGSP